MSVAVVGVALATAGVVPSSLAAERPHSGGAHAAAKVTVPRLHCRRLDVAEEILRGVGLRYKEIGGGAFGILVKSNWKVQSTIPGAGARVKRHTRVKLIVGRDC